MPRHQAVLAAVLAIVGLGCIPQTAGASPHLLVDGRVQTRAVPTSSAPHTELVTQAGKAPFQAGVFIVVLRAEPLASYDGHRPGYPATRPGAGDRFRDDRPVVGRYRQLLLARQNAVLVALGRPQVLYRYTTAIDGFTARLTAQQAKLASVTRGVAFVEPDALAHLDSTAVRLAYGGAGVPPSSLSERRAAARGHGVVIGIIDSGIWPESPSFAGIPATRAAIRRAYPGFTGSCGRGQDWSPSLCDSKLIAARDFVRGFGRHNLSVNEKVSPRDTSGHGSGTASIAAGNVAVSVTIGKRGLGSISGSAPGAALAVYKACWSAPDPNQDGCATSDVLKAIDTAVRDGVDVISDSIADSPDALDPGAVGTAFMNAADAGVVVATSAGDGGPWPSTVGHDVPWVTTVGASAGASYDGEVVLGNGVDYRGAMFSTRAVGTSALVYGGDVAASDTSSEHAALCYPGSLDASAVDGAIVVCDRGRIARVDKGAAVRQAGGVGMVLVNVRHGSTDPDLQSVPTVHVGVSAGSAIKAYVDSASTPTARLVPSGQSAGSAGIARFSARGPGLFAGGAVLKPDISAAGTNVLAATSPSTSGGQLWALASGTSMAAPDVAGVAAVVLAAHPDWTPSMIASALQTTARPLAADPFAAGAGEVDPKAAVDPGLVYAVGPRAWRDAAADLADGRARPLDRLDLPSISVPDLVGRTTLTRRVTNVADTTESYVASVSRPPGIGLSVEPSTFTLAPGESATYTVTLTARRQARYGEFAAGTLTWVGSRGHRVRSALVVRPAYAKAPALVRTSTRQGVALVRARAGVTGTIRARMIGPVAAVPHSFRLPFAPFDASSPSVGTWSAFDRVGEHAAAVRFEADSTNGADLDLYVYANGVLVASAASRHHNEAITLHDPESGRYDVYVAASPGRQQGTGSRMATGSFTGWVLPRSAHRRDASVGRRWLVTGGESFAIAVPVAGLGSTRRWFGELSLADSETVTDIVVNEPTPRRG